MKKILILIYFCLIFSLKAHGDVVIVRDVADSPAINDIINNIVNSVENFIPKNMHIYTNKEFENIESSKLIVAIGDKSISKIKEYESDGVRKIYIGSMSPSNNYFSFAFTPSPRDVIRTIKENFPSKEQIYIVSNKRNEWLDKHYKKYCDEYDIKVSFYYANSIRDAIEHYKNILSKINNKKSMILLNENSLVDEDAILPFILNKSWDDDVVVVSTKAAHAKYGILMSLVPDVKNFGKQVNECLSTECAEIKNIDGFNVATPLVNKRMYKHLELNFNNDVIFLE